MIPSLLVILPVLDAAQGEACLASILAPDSSFGIPPEQLLVIDNTRDGCFLDAPTYRDPYAHNLGVARSWNIGARRVIEEQLDYLVMLSTSMRFGPALHTTWAQQMETFAGWHVIESEGHSLHLWALHREALETVGLFDTNFYPAYFEEIDWHQRMRCCGYPGKLGQYGADGWPNAWVNAVSLGYARHVHEGIEPELVKVQCPAGPLLEYYRTKHGGDKGEERYRLPFDGKPIGWFEERSIPELAAAYGLGEEGIGWW